MKKKYDDLEEIISRTRAAISAVKPEDQYRKTDTGNEVPVSVPPKREVILHTRPREEPPRKIKPDFLEPINGWWPLENVGIKMPDKKFGTAEMRVGKLVRMGAEKAVIIIGGIYSNEEIISVSPNNLVKIHDYYNKKLWGELECKEDTAESESKTDETPKTSEPSGEPPTSLET